MNPYNKFLSSDWAIVFFWSAIGALFVGWVWNIVKIFQSFDGHVTTELIVRIVGLITVPVGGIVGYI